MLCSTIVSSDMQQICELPTPEQTNGDEKE